jgi:hypothetical protein
MKKLLLYTFPLFLILHSCDREAKDIIPPEVDPQLVVFSFLSPEEQVVKVEVSLSKPVYGKPRYNSVVNNAVVTIKNDGGFTATLIYNDSAEAYLIPQTLFPIEPGRTYAVHVTADGETVTGTSTVPLDTVQFREVTSEKRSGFDGEFNMYLYKWQDQNGFKNYYRTTIESENTYIDFFGDTVSSVNDICSNTFSDENRNGQVLSGTCEGYNSYYSSDTAAYPVIFYLLNTDIHYYEYHKRRLNYYGDDPFSEPFQQYSNVKGGLGVICSYRLTKKTLMVTP